MDEYQVLTTILTIFFFIATGYFGRKWVKIKALLKEVSEALTTVSDAIEDDDITQEELRELAQEFQDVIETARQLTGPNP